MYSDNKLIEIAKGYEDKKDWAKALEVWEKLKERKPESVEVLLNVGWCQSRLERYDDSIATFHRAVNKDPKNATYHYMIGYQYYGLQQWDKAIVWFENATRLRPNYMKATYRLGYALLASCGKIYQMKNANFHKALERFKECESIGNMIDGNEKKNLTSEYVKACYQLGKMYIMKNEFEDAINYLQKANTIKPTPEGKYQLAKALRAMGKPEEALKILPEAKDKDYVVQLKASLFIDVGQVDKGLKLLIPLVKKKRKDYLLRTVAEAYIMEEDINSAYSYSMQAMSLNYNNHKNHLLLSQVYKKAGLLYKAKEEIRKAIDLCKDRYKTEYKEGKELLDSINQEILKTGHRKDDLAMLEELKKSSVSEECSSREGIVTKYNKDRGFGFIDSRGESIFFHISKVPQRHRINVKEGMEVCFSSEVTNKGMAATDVTPIDDFKARSD